MKIANLIRSNQCVWRLARSIRTFIDKLRPVKGKGNTVDCKGIMYKCAKSVIGNNNRIVIGKDSSLTRTSFRIHGNNNLLLIEDHVTVGGGCSFWLEGNNNTIIVRSNTTFTQKVHINAQEHDIKIEIGEDCMLSNNIIIRTSDSHPIIDKNSGQRINFPKSVIIGKHVWIAPSTTIMKGVSVGDNSIIGSHSVVLHSVLSNCLAVGIPAKVVKENVTWTRDDVLF